jgi:hypothetical protein
MALTIKRIDALKEPGRYNDGDGLLLVVKASGSKSWILRTMVRGKRTDIGLGGYPSRKRLSIRRTQISSPVVNMNT